MKKLLSTFLAVAMIVTLFVPMAAQAAISTITLPTTPGESVLLEAETYVDDFIVNGKKQSVATSTQSYAKTNNSFAATESNLLSGGKALYSGSFGSNTVTLTFPVSVDKSTIFEMECHAGFGGHLNQNYWTIDGRSIFSTAYNSSYASGGTICYLDASQNYPIGKYICRFLIPAGTHELTYQMPKRTATVGGAFALDYVKLTATDGAIPAISWKEAPAISAKASGKTMAVTFTDSGIETINGVESPVNKYLIEMYPKDTTNPKMVLSHIFTAYTGDKKDANGNVLTRPTTYTAHIPFSKILCGTFYVKIYPIGLTYESILGEAAISDTFTVTENTPGYANRYEIEDYWTFKTPNVVFDSPYASGGKLLTSTQSGALWTKSMISLSDKNAEWWQDTYDITFDVDLPENTMYDIETVMGKNGDGHVDFITVSVDGDVIYTNAIANASEDLSINGLYSWSYLYACRYHAEKELSAGKHTVKFSVARPTVASQPHLFMMDYIQFKPVKPSLGQNFSTTLEMEDYIDNFVAYDGDVTQAFTPSIIQSGNAGNGKAITTDRSFTFDGVTKSVPIRANIPITVREDGYYSFEVLESGAGCNGYLTISNNSNTATAITSFAEGVKLSENGSGLDTADEIRENYWTYFGVKWHSARLSNGLAYLSKGDYTLNVHYNGRQIGNGASGMAFMIDYVKVTPVASPEATIAANGETFLEIDDYTKYFVKDKNVSLPAKVVNHAKAHNGKLASITESPMATGHDFSITINAENAGWYDMGSVMSVNNGGWTSLVTLSVNDIPVIKGDRNKAVEDLSDPYVDENGKNQARYIDNSYLMHRFSEKVYLNEGENKLTIHAAPRTQKTDAEKASDEAAIAAGGTAGNYMVGYFIDYISFKPVADDVAIDGAKVSGTVVYDKAVSGKLIVAAYDGKDLIGTYTTDISGLFADINTTFKAAPDTVKVFVWKDLTNIEPITAPKIFQ